MNASTHAGEARRAASLPASAAGAATAVARASGGDTTRGRGGVNSASSRPHVTVVVPVHNGAATLERCLDALSASADARFDVLVVDDASTDGSGELAAGKGVRVARLARRSGPAAARNAGAVQSAGDVLLFVDADVLVRPDTVARAAAEFARDPTLAAVFGSYDDSPAEPGVVSQYKNLAHHFIHQRSDEEAETFWAGCGAIRRAAFESVGGFDSVAYAEPSVEDIELGYRLREKGFRIRLDKGLQVKHLKRWNFVSLVRADIFLRAVPWSRLILLGGRAEHGLNLRTRYRVSAALLWACMLVALPAAAWLDSRAWPAPFALALAAFLLNLDLYRFLAARKGLLFLAAAVPLHWLYYLYGSATFVACWLQLRLRLPHGAAAKSSTGSEA
jgi:GT2 family glycosyltransferase